MLRSSLLWGLYATYAVLIVLSAALVGGLLAGRMETRTRDDLAAGLRAQAAMLGEVAAPALAGEPARDLQARVRRLGAETGTRFTVIRADGRVLADSDEDPAAMEDHARRPEVLAAEADGVGIATRYSHTVKDQLLYVALRVDGAAGPQGYVRAAIPLTAVREHLAGFRRLVLLGAAITGAAALAIGLLFARQVTRPLSAVIGMAEAIVGGAEAPRVTTTRADEVGRLTRAINSLADELQDRIATLTQNRNEVLAILGSMTEGVVAVDEHERIVHMNAVAAELLRTGPESCLGRPIWEVTRVREVSDLLAHTIRDAAEGTGEMRLVGHGGDRIIEMHAAPLRGSEGANAGAVVVLQDVTDLRRLEAIRRDFVANVSHELKTPITAIRGLVETLREDATMEPATRERFLDKVQNQSIRLSNLVQDLLTLARLESTDAPGRRRPLDLREPLRASAFAVRADLQEKGLRFETDLPDRPVRIEGDAEGLRQLVDNLLDNARKYTPAGGTIRLALHAGDGWATLEVSDTGIGIEPQHQERVFERFYRVDKARSRELGGTGLGLSIVKHITLAHGGELSLQSTPGTGSTFRVRLPLPPADAA